MSGESMRVRIGMGEESGWVLWVVRGGQCGRDGASIY